MSAGSIAPSINDSAVYGQVVVNPDGSSIGEQLYITETYPAEETIEGQSYDVVYLCQAVAGTPLSAPLWRVLRTATNATTGAVSSRYAGGTAKFASAATDLATVQAHTYS